MFFYGQKVISPSEIGMTSSGFGEPMRNGKGAPAVDASLAEHKILFFHNHCSRVLLMVQYRTTFVPARRARSICVR
jgi:hypothetical protein